ncbi:hypothetical protein EJB05_09155, partial [Eragrostis curvula]
MKKRSKGGAGNPHLPAEIIDEILLLVPARCVFRFRAVCRSWAARLSSPTFTDAYYAAAKAKSKTCTDDACRKFVVFAPSSPGPSTLVYCCSNQGDSSLLLTADHLRTDFLSLSCRPSRGLFLFSDTRADAGHYWVCNPSTGECRALPPPPERRGVSLSSAGLALDDMALECKVVHLVFREGMTKEAVRCEVLTLGAPGFRWRHAAGGGLDGGGLERKIFQALRTEEAVAKVPPVFADGCLHWLMRYPAGRRRDANGVLQRQGQDAILRFSAADESLALVSAPEGVPFEDYIGLQDEERLPMVPVHLAELNGLLCMVHDRRRRHRPGQSFLDVWVRSSSSSSIRGGGEWSLDYRIPVTPLLARDVHGPRLITVLGSCYNSNQRLLLATSEHNVYSYAADTGRVETVFETSSSNIGLQKEAPAELLLGVYEDSLIRIGQAREKEEAGSSSSSSAVLTQVLLRLPLKSIAQSKLLGREWCALIESKSFVAAHMSINKRPKRRRILAVTSGRARHAFFEFAPPQSWMQRGAGSSRPPVAQHHLEDKLLCSKPCHGLNLISTSTDDYLCNPCTGDVQCLTIRGRSRFTPCCSSSGAAADVGQLHAFTVGRNVGFGFDHKTGEHVAVEIGRLCGAPACILKTSESDSWTCAGTPPMSVTDMPPAHVDGTLYWMGKEQVQAEHIVIVAFNISTRAFDVIRCEQPNTNHHGSASLFLVELDNTLSLVITNSDAEEMEIWMMDIKLRAWVSVHRICLRGQPDFSPRTTEAAVVVPMDISGDDGRILLSTGRALGYYDAKTGIIDTVYSLDIPPYTLAWPILCEESLVPVPDEDYLPVDRVAPPPSIHGHMAADRGRICDHPGHAVADSSTTPTPIFPECQSQEYCQRTGVFYSYCCRRLVCRRCIRCCAGHYKGQHIPLDNFYHDVIEEIQRNGWPVRHPLVPDPDYYCYYYSEPINNEDGNVVRHVFISQRDLVLGKLPCRLIECAYRMDGHGDVIETWARRYIDFDYGRE